MMKAAMKAAWVQSYIVFSIKTLMNYQKMNLQNFGIVQNIFHHWPIR